MSAWLSLVQFALLTSGLFAAMTALTIAAAYPWLRRRLAAVEPTRRARLLTLLAIAPVFVAALDTTLCFAPGLLGRVLPLVDHCVTDAGHSHPHLCAIHLPTDPGTALGWMALALLGAGWGLRATLEIGKLAGSHRALATLQRAARPTAEPTTYIVPTDVPIAIAMPLSQRVVLSSRLVFALPRELLAAVMEHEWAHVRRHDPLRRSLAQVLSVVHLPATQRAILSDLELACEQACDEEAGRRVDDRLIVARALLAVERLFEQAGRAELGTLPARFTGSNVVRRVESLLSPPLPQAQGWLERYAVAVLIIASAAFADPLHHMAETVVGLLS